MTKNIAENTLARIVRLGKGAVFTPKDFLDLASHETVRQTLWRLAKEGKIRRLLRGVYEYPMFSKMMNAPAAPAPDAIAHAIAHTHGWTIVPTGPTALNRLGLSTQVPAHWQYLSDGPSKNFTWAGGTLVLKHRTNKETATLSPKTALLVQALKSLGTENIDASTVATLRSKFNSKERARALKEARYVTSWVYEIIKQLALKDTPHA